MVRVTGTISKILQCSAKTVLGWLRCLVPQPRWIQWKKLANRGQLCLLVSVKEPNQTRGTAVSKSRSYGCVEIHYTTTYTLTTDHLYPLLQWAMKLINYWQPMVNSYKVNSAYGMMNGKKE